LVFLEIFVGNILRVAERGFLRAYLGKVKPEAMRALIDRP
jgi:hypothetical protein